MNVAIVAGETSGDLLGAGLIRAIRRHAPAGYVEGIAGEEMLGAGCESLYPMERLSVMGLFESFGRYPELVPARSRLARRLIERRPDVFIGIDAPDFNIPLERRLRAAGIPTVHYVSPSVWAWRQYRIRKIARAVNLMLVLFPFEADFYTRHGVGVEFVGHPLADMIPDSVQKSDARRALGIEAEGAVVALLPGSRMSEVGHLARPMLDTAHWLTRRVPALRFVMPLVNRKTQEAFEQQLEPSDKALDLQRIEGRSREAMAAADVVLVASGTATLEAMLLKRPMVITFRTSSLSFRILKLLVGRNIRYAGLPNLLAGRSLVPELMQDDAVAEKLGPAVLDYLEHPELAERLAEQFQEIHTGLRRDASESAARAVLRLVEA